MLTAGHRERVKLALPIQQSPDSAKFRLRWSGPSGLNYMVEAAWPKEELSASISRFLLWLWPTPTPAESPVGFGTKTNSDIQERQAT